MIVSLKRYGTLKEVPENKHALSVKFVDFRYFFVNFVDTARNVVAIRQGL